MLICLLQALEASGGRLVLRSPMPPVREVLDLMELGRAGIVINA